MEEEEDNEDVCLEELNFDDDYDPNANYAQEEEGFVETKQILERNDTFGSFSADFAKLLNAWKASHRREVYFVEERRKIRTEVEDCKSKLQAMENLQSADQATIQKLQNEIRSAWKVVDEAHTREQLTQEQMDSLRSQVIKLSQELDLNKKMGAEQDQEAGQMTKNKEALMREKERLIAELLVSKGKLTKASKYQKELEEKLETCEKKNVDLHVEQEALRTDLTKERRLKDKLSVDVDHLFEEIRKKEKETMSQSSMIEQLENTAAKFEAQVKENRMTIEKLNRDLQESGTALKNAKLDIENQQATISRLHHTISEKNHEIKLKEDDHQRLKFEEHKLLKLNESILRKLELINSQKTDLEQEKLRLTNLMGSMEKEHGDLRKEISNDHKMIEHFQREREHNSKQAMKASAVTQEQQATISLLQLAKKRLEDTVGELQSQLTALQKEVKAACNERDLTNAELTLSKNKGYQLEEDVRFRENQIEETRKKIGDAEAKMKLHVTLFEQMRTEKNKVSKRLVEAEDEIKELTNKLKVKTYEVEQLKEDMALKEKQLVKGEFVTLKVTKEKESLRLEKNNLNIEMKDLKEKCHTLEIESRRMQKMLEDAESDKEKITRELAQMTNERDKVTEQLGTKLEELRLTYEKINILEEIVRKGETQYQQRLDDIRLLKIEVKRVKQEKALIARDMENSVELRRELFHLERDFTRERLKSRTLEEELSNPLNVHRWRKLEGSDPNTFELINKVRLLQKRIIAANEEAIKRDQQLNDAKKKIEELETAMSRLPDSEFLDKINVQTISLRDKTSKIKTLQAELSMYENQVAEYKIEMEHKNKEINDLKKKYYGLKRREQKVRERETDLERSKSFFPLLESSGPTGKFVGGGFNVGPPQHKMSV